MPLLHWQNDLAGEFDVLHPFLRPNGRRAEDYMLPNSRIRYKVVYYKEDDIYAIDPEDYDNMFSLSREDVVIYEINRRGFRDVLAETLGLRVSHEDFHVADRVIPLGLWEREGETYPVRLVIERGPDHFADEIFRMMVQETAPVIVLSLTDRSWTEEITSLFRQRKSSLALLKEVVEVDAGVWKATESWRETVLGFLDMLNPPGMVAAPPPFEFRRKGEYWVIRFEGEEMFLKDALGLRCIAQLLAKPNEPVFVSDLKMIVDGQNPENLPTPTSTGEVADPEYLRDVARKYITCEMEYNDAKDRGEAALAKEIQEEMTKFMDFLREAKGFGGRIKEANEQLSSIRIAVYRAVNRTLESIKVELPDCFSHFSRTISTGLVLNYASEMKYPWIL